jgi:2-amino-4-hydroxy-6-hydroxymethyldihydropteridine diphosphokinase
MGAIGRALQSLNESGIQVQDVSGLYESSPMYVQEQPQFVNAVCKVSPMATTLIQARTKLSPQQCLSTLKRIESEAGRLPSIRNGPRTLDLDILLYGRGIVNKPDLIIPHLSMLERGFVLQPLAE